MRRHTFTSIAEQLHSELCECLLIAEGYEYIPWEHVQSTGFEVDFVLAGTAVDPPEPSSFFPTIILSTGQVYSCIKSTGQIVEEPFPEHGPLVVPSTNASSHQAQCIVDESMTREAFPDHAVVRLFDIYGPGAYGWVNFYLDQLRTNAPLLVQHSPHRKLSCLFVDDFRDAFLAFVEHFLKRKVRGLYNLGSDQATSFSHLADTVFQAWSGTKEKAPIQLEPAPNYVNFYEVPDITRIKALLGWCPKTTLRKGIWTTVQELR